MRERIRNYIIVLTIALGFTTKALAQTDYPKYETRAIWLTTIGGLDWPHSYSQSPRSADKQKKEFTALLDKIAEANINTVLLQTRIRATTIYPSKYEPWDGCLSGMPGVSPGYDALQFAIDECHKRGIELHAWIVTMPVGNWNGFGCKWLRKRHPRMIVKNGNEGFMNPELAETAQYLASVCCEIASLYDVDGIHLDYIRYPENFNIKVSKPMARENITRIVRAVNKGVKAIKPWIKLSCSPIGKYDDLTRYWSHGWNAYSRTCQDAQGWLRQGLMDVLFPMMYFRGDQFYPFALDWTEHCYGNDVVAGLGAYMLSTNEGNWTLDEIKRQISFSRSIGMGQAYFRSKFLTDNTKGLYEYVKNIANPYPSLSHPVAQPSISHQKPSAPEDLKVKRTALGHYISWKNGENHTLFNIYASNDSIVDISNPRNLVATRFKGSGIMVKGLNVKSFAVTAIDRFGYESNASIFKERELPRLGKTIGVCN